MFEKGVAIVALTKWGVSTSAKIARVLENSHIEYNIYAPRQLCSDKILPFDAKLGKLFEKLFNEFEAIVAVMAIGIVVRSLASLIVSKHTDPAIVVVDDLGKYAISLLSGHIGGANKLTKIIASGINAVPVVTTATDILGKKCVEEIAEERDLSIVNSEALVQVNSAIVNGKRILIAKVGEVACPKVELENTDTWSISNAEQLKETITNYDASIVITSSMPSLEGINKPVVILTPRIASDLLRKNNR